MPPSASTDPAAAPLAAASPQAKDFHSLLEQKFKLATDDESENDHRAQQVRTSVQTLAAQAIKRTGTITAGGDVLDYIQALISQIDSDISKQLNQIMHHPKFTKLEGAWRGLDHLVRNTETDKDLKIRVLNVTQRELYRELAAKAGTNWDQSAIFRKIYEEEFGMPGGQPYGALIGDFEFGYSTQDILVLREMSKIAAAAHCPFITAAGPKLMQMNSWQELSNPRDLGKLLDTPDYAAWRSFRESQDSRFVGLAMPRFLARAPYGTKDNPVNGFDFEEDVRSSDHHHYVWANSAYAMGVNITRAFKEHGWCVRIRGVESGGTVENLPVHSFPTSDGGVDIKVPTEIGITDRREKELATLGLMPLSHWKNEDYAVFIGAQSAHKPEKFYSEDANSNANLSARLPYLFACCRFAHYLKCMVRDKIGAFMETDELRMWLQDWIMNYVTDSKASEAMKLQRPLSEAQVHVQPDPDDPGSYYAQFDLRPHFQLEQVNISLRLVSKLKRADA
ncbi:MAG TPA: type VI secretion system contractile sheath large subunit [Chthoniobacteraceae bacterium]|jgi:type VI secretion system protein ImpC|nr:type VI secretion system contractile sheath large subunit [Chthoniobacteraceae bacterium]